LFTYNVTEEDDGGLDDYDEWCSICILGITN
jgi:hypothetical protein